MNKFLWSTEGRARTCGTQRPEPPQAGEPHRRRRQCVLSGLKFTRVVACLMVLVFASLALESQAQEASQDDRQKEVGQLTLRKTARAREYGGRVVEGEDRLVAPGDSVWRMLIREKGLPERRFGHYLAIIRGLNPQIKNMDVLKVGDTIFLPSRPEDLLGTQAETKKEATPTIARGTTRDYRIRGGEHLYQILREQLGLKAERELAIHYALVKDLNPEKKNWDVLIEGEVIRLPVPPQTAEVASTQTKVADESKRAEVRVPQAKVAEEIKPAPEVRAPAKVAEAVKPEPAPKVPEKTEPRPTEIATVKEARPDVEVPKLKEPPPAIEVPKVKEPTPGIRLVPDYAKQALTRDNISLLTRVIEALGNEVQRGGQEVFSLSDGTVRLDKSAFPVVYSPQLRQKLILDLNESIPASLKAKLAHPSVATPVISVTKEASLHGTVSQLLTGLGYQLMPADRPIVIYDGGIALEAKGTWVVLAPEESNKVQEVFVVTLSDRPDEIPGYLKTALSQKGLHLRDILLPAATSHSFGDGNNERKALQVSIKRWPEDKKQLIDAMLSAFGIPVAVSETLTVELHQGLRMELRGERIFESNGRRTALVFQRVEPEIKRALKERQGLTLHELDISTLTRKEIVSRLLTEIGEQAAYREHRFAAANGFNKERLNITASGFLLADRGMFVTDREIPQSLQRFFFEKGLEIVYFQ
jgi:hypothetical protein